MKRLEEYLFGAGQSGLTRWLHNSDTVINISRMTEDVKLENSGSKNFAALKDKRFIGLEFELENVNSLPLLTPLMKSNSIAAEIEYQKFWLMTNDGSLRNNGKEFVTYKGVHTGNVREALEAFGAAFKWFLNGSKVQISSRCSVHVHYNVWDITLPELRSLVLAYMFVERALYIISGNRYNNIFCVPCGKMKRSTWEGLFSPSSGLTENNMWDTLHSSFHKYAGLNLKPMFDYGTIEFRQHKGTLDVYRIYDWVSIIDELITNSRKIPVETLRKLGQDCWNNNELEKLVKLLSPQLLYKLQGYNINSLLEPDIKYGLWASTPSQLLPVLDDSPNGKSSPKKKSIEQPAHILTSIDIGGGGNSTTYTLNAVNLSDIDWAEVLPPASSA